MIAHLVRQGYVEGLDTVLAQGHEILTEENAAAEEHLARIEGAMGPGASPPIYRESRLTAMRRAARVVRGETLR